MVYSVFIQKSAQKSLSRISEPNQSRIIRVIRSLVNNPRPHGIKKLTGREAWRVRAGDYRIIFEIHDSQLTILIVNVGHRKEIYR